MEYLQYEGSKKMNGLILYSFKPYYKWNTFNTYFETRNPIFINFVLNLIINGIPSIHSGGITNEKKFKSFKPYYKWNTFNTLTLIKLQNFLLQCFKPYYKWNTFNTY